MDQLSQIFDRVDVMVRRWGDQGHTWHRVTQLTDVFGNLSTRQLPTFTRLGALCHLDLDLIGIHQILCRYTEAARSNLLDRRTQRIAILEGVITLNTAGADDFRQGLTSLEGQDGLGILTTFTGIRLAADTV